MVSPTQYSGIFVKGQDLKKKTKISLNIGLVEISCLIVVTALLPASKSALRFFEMRQFYSHYCTILLQNGCAHKYNSYMNTALRAIVRENKNYYYQSVMSHCL